MVLGASLVFGGVPSSRWLGLAGFFILAYNALFLWASRERSWSRKSCAYLQISLDWIVLTFLAWISDGAASPLIPFFLFHVIIAAILFDRSEAYIQTAVAVALILILGQTGDSSLPWSRWSLTMFGFSVPLNWVLLAFVFFTTAYLVSSIAGILREREKELELANRELEKKADEKNRFFLSTAHSLKTPLSSLESLVQSFLYYSKGQLSAEIQDIMLRVQLRLHNLSILVKDLLVLASSKKSAASKAQPFSLETTFQAAVNKLKPQIEQKNISLVFESDPNASGVMGDEDEWKSVCENIVDNAVKYTPREGSVTVSIQRVGNGLRCSVRDTGIGIPQEELPRVFDEFYRAENARSYAEEGTGLGLSIIKNIVEKAGGQIQVESRVGAGTSVTFYVPSN